MLIKITRGSGIIIIITVIYTYLNIDDPYFIF